MPLSTPRFPLSAGALPLRAQQRGAWLAAELGQLSLPAPGFVLALCV